MPTSKSTLTYLGECLALVPEVTFRAMMGGHCVYSCGRIFGLVGDGILFLKTTPETVPLFDNQETRAYPGSKNSSPVNPEWLENPEKLAEIVKLTLKNLPMSKKKIS